METHSLTVAAKLASDRWPDSRITLLSTSRALVKALNAPENTSRSLETCRAFLNKLGKARTVNLRWLNSKQSQKSFHTGNNIGTTANTLPTPGAPMSFFKTINRNIALKDWNNRWKERTDCRQTKLWYPQLHLSKSAQLCRLTRPALSLLVQAVTGHNNLGYHMSLMDPQTDPTCRLCLEDTESSEHILAECPALVQERANLSKGHILSEWTVDELSRFLTNPHVAELYCSPIIE